MPAPRKNPKAFADWYEQDYFRRPRRLLTWTATVIVSLAVCAIALATTFVWKGGRTVYQAGPLSNPHAFLSDNCAACHTESMQTVKRLWPGNSDYRTVSDQACLQCHAAGAHSPHQLHNTGPNQQSANCAGCHREHRGGATIARIEDSYCVGCHANLQTDAGPSRFAHSITHFDSDHPKFGAWRGGELSDPGTLKFNHKVHLELAASLKGVSAERLGPMAKAVEKLENQSCTACHEPDDDRNYMRPVSYDRHCAACHPISAFAGGQAERLQHPKPGESAANVRGALLDRYWKQIASQQPSAPASEAERPAILKPSLPHLSSDQKRAVDAKAREAESRVFAQDGGDVLTILEKPLFQVRGGCAYCHTEVGREDGLPQYAAPRQRDRWKGMPFPHERFGDPASGQTARNRWFPYAKFSHEIHRMLKCSECHVDVDKNTDPKQVLMPTYETCKACHNRSAVGVRSDCLECHIYHDRSTELIGQKGQMTIQEILNPTNR